MPFELALLVPIVNPLELGLLVSTAVASWHGVSTSIQERSDRRRARVVDAGKAERFRSMVREVCAEQGVEPPGRVLLLEGRDVQAEATRLGGRGRGASSPPKPWSMSCLPMSNER